MGMERLLTLMPETAEEKVPAPIVVLPLVDAPAADASAEALAAAATSAEAIGSCAVTVARALRDAKHRTELEGRRVRLKTALSRAEKLGARFVVLVGSKEAATGVVSLKDLAKRAQHDVPVSEVVTFLERALSEGAEGG
jgi:histidyl-tRNA synthetase